jgi:hypothetical protein
MAWSDSRVFDQMLLGALDRTTTFDLDGDAFKVALYDNDVVPDRSATLANTATNAGQWAYTGNEVTDASGWPSGGRSLVSPDVTTGAGYVMWDATDTASANSTTTLTANYGCHVWDDTITTPTADPGICFLYFGGSNSVTNGLYTIVYHANGLFRLTT